MAVRARSRPGKAALPRRRPMVEVVIMHVHGVDGLSVVDASAMPYCPISATHAPTMMLAEKAADLLLGNTPLAPAHPSILTLPPSGIGPS